MIPQVVGWLDLPIVLALEVLVTRMLQNAKPDSDDQEEPMTYSERVAWLATIPDSQLSAEELQIREDDRLLALFGMTRPAKKAATGG